VAKKSLRARGAEVGTLRVTDVAFRPKFVSPPHSHLHDCLTVVLAGDMGKDDRALSGGAVALTPGRMTHVDRFGSAGGRVVVVEMRERVDGLSSRRNSFTTASSSA
jgi:hypothetical protein